MAHERKKCPACRFSAKPKSELKICPACGDDLTAETLFDIKVIVNPSRVNVVVQNAPGPQRRPPPGSSSRMSFTATPGSCSRVIAHSIEWEIAISKGFVIGKAARSFIKPTRGSRTTLATAQLVANSNAPDSDTDSLVTSPRGANAPRVSSQTRSLSSSARRLPIVRGP